MERLLRIEQVTDVTGVPEATLRWKRHMGEGPRSFKLAGRVVYKESDVEAWVEAQYAAGKPAA